MRTEGCIIGKYQGRQVYKVTFPEYVNSRLYKNKDNIYLIDGELIYNNKVFASYDGNYVTVYNPHKKRIFYTVPIFTANNKSLHKEGSESKDSEETSSTSGNEITPPKSVEETLAGVYDTDYLSGMTDVDAFLKANSEF